MKHGCAHGNYGSNTEWRLDGGSGRDTLLYIVKGSLSMARWLANNWLTYEALDRERSLYSITVEKARNQLRKQHIRYR